MLTPPAPYRLRSMQLFDIEAVMAIERDSFPSSWSATGYRHELTANENAHYVVLEVFENQGPSAVIGYAGHWIVAGEAHISTIAVSPGWRRRGLGALLLLSMIFHALDHDAHVVSLEVRDTNDAAQTLYEAFGFVTVGRRRRYYHDTGDDAILMDLNLQGEGVREELERRRAQLWERLRARLA